MSYRTLKISYKLKKTYTFTEDITLGGFIVGSKNSLQRAKQLLDNYFTNRNAVPEFYSNRDPLNEEIQKSVEAV